MSEWTLFSRIQSYEDYFREQTAAFELSLGCYGLHHCPKADVKCNVA